jgi:ribosomal protein S18 acetylase RimI-like enzyme
VDEVDRVEEIDRTEVIDHIYYLRDGRLVLEEEQWELSDWPPGVLDEHKDMMRDCIRRGGTAWGAFDGDRLVGIAALDAKWIGPAGDTLQFYFLHVSNGYRDKGIGGTLTGMVKERAMEMGARRLYVSGLPSLHTITFYQGQGFDLAREVDPELYEREPEDIHMDLDLLRSG